MQAALEPFHTAYGHGMAMEVADFFTPVAPADDPMRLSAFSRASNEANVEVDIRYALKAGEYKVLVPYAEIEPWKEILVKYWRAVGHIIKAKEAANQGKSTASHHVAVYKAWNNLTESFVKHIALPNHLPPWAIFTIYFIANHQRKLALIADEQLKLSPPAVVETGYSDDIISTVSRNVSLTETAQVLNRIYSLCLGDRTTELRASRKWGVYCTANLLFKVYFKLNNISLSKNVIRALEAQADLPPINNYPQAHRVTYRYYTGVLAFLEEDYKKAEENLQLAWDNCLATCQRNKELILTYLIPCRLITQHKVPSTALLAEFPRLERMFGPLMARIKRGDLTGFDKALADGEPDFVRLRIFLTLERGRNIALRNLIRKVYLAAGFDDLKAGQTEKDRVRKSRVPLANFVAGFKIGTEGEGSGEDLEVEEVECLIVNQICLGLMKGYISREHSMVVLNKKGAFPGTGV
ncbi:hypothetical protein IQ07DRAFT_584775 [Pyrenochaeta sp. DS3sAY3a]|nr:hypothetical protein IQ07DRAFT_584775 [Pyrenochaeta sp. DS3sAY3a]